MAESTEPPNVENLVADGKNKDTIYCVNCPSKILCKGVGRYKEIEYSLPDMRPRKAEPGSSEEMLKDYWQVDDIYHFENIGYSKVVDGRKFLICADCELGPLGWQDLETKLSYLSLTRVKYSN